MATYSTFEELKVWQSSRALNKDLYQLLMEKDDRKFGFLINHIFKTAGSVMDNIAEGHGRQGTKEYILFLSYSMGSTDELRSQLYRAMDLELISEADFEKLRNHCFDIITQLTYFTNYLKKSDFEGINSIGKRYNLKYRPTKRHTHFSHSTERSTQNVQSTSNKQCAKHFKLTNIFPNFR